MNRPGSEDSGMGAETKSGFPVMLKGVRCLDSAGGFFIKEQEEIPVVSEPGEVSSVRITQAVASGARLSD